MSTLTTGVQQRLFKFTELRVADIGGKKILQGYSALYDSWSETLGGYFREIIRPGAFANALRNSDVRCLFNHDSNVVLGRSKPGTLKLIEDSRGLRMECDLPNTQAATDLRESINRGDIDGQSFSFTTKQDRWTFSNDSKKPAERELLEVEELFDVGPVTWPAYPETTVGVRCREVNREILEAARRMHDANPQRFENHVLAELAIIEAEDSAAA
jgi:hypothetical protein